MSLDRESELRLSSDAEAVVEYLSEHGGRLYVPPKDGDRGEWWLELHPSADPTETYFVRALWFSYPGAPPSVKFSHELRGSLVDPTAWPNIPGYRPTALDICMPFTQEGFSAHAEWRLSAEVWNGDGNPFLWVAQNLQRDLNNRYSGRYGG